MSRLKPNNFTAGIVVAVLPPAVAIEALMSALARRVVVFLLSLRR
jgi:hypothetical protein